MLGLRLIGTVAKTWLDRLGDLNPQFLRELKGRLKWFPVLAAVGFSLLVQLVILVGFSLALPGPISNHDLTLMTYPRLQLGESADLSQNARQRVLEPTALPNAVERALIRKHGVFVTQVGKPGAADMLLGGLPSLPETAEPIRQGDRLVAINGQPILLQPPNASVPSDEDATQPLGTQEIPLWSLSDIVQSMNGETINAPRRQAVGTQVELTFFRPERGEFTVTLPRVAIVNRYHSYCTGAKSHHSYSSPKCHLTADQQAFQVDWRRWHRAVFSTLSIAITFPLMGMGVFLLAHNLAEEKRRGTLNFLQMSPRSPFTILTGKIFGVPICLYLAIALMFPFHWHAGLAAGFSPGHLLGFDIALISQTVIFYLVALLLSLSVAHSMLLALLPWLLAASVIALQWAITAAVSTSTFPIDLPTHPFIWAVTFAPLASISFFTNHPDLANTPSGINLAVSIFRVNFTEYTVLVVIHSLGWCALLGHALQRRFSNSTVTLLKRRYSYGLTGLFMAIVLGLTETQAKDYDMPSYVALIALLGLAYSLVLMLSLTCDRQTLQDWARFRHEQTPGQRLPLWKDLLIGDTSSPIVAIALNLLIQIGLFAGWFGLHYAETLDTRLDLVGFWGSLWLFGGSLLFAVLASQILMLSRRQKSWFWFGSIGSVSCLAFPTLTLLIGIMVMTPQPMYPGQVLGLPPEIAVFAIPSSLLGTVMAMLTFLHLRQLTLVGRSESQQLFRGASLPSR